MNAAYMIMDLQYGSTGKGLLAGYLAKERQPDVVVTAWGPNAGHTYIDENGREFVHTMLANGVVSPKLEAVLIGPGSVIDLSNLITEMGSCREYLEGKLIVIHPQAAIRTDMHLTAEKLYNTIGSTMKGTAEAKMQVMRRNPSKMNTAQHAIGLDTLDTMAAVSGANVIVDASLYDICVMGSQCMQIEGAQGFGLSMYHGFYPHVTSRDVTPSQVLADCAIPYGCKPEVYGTLRTFPIRVSNRKGKDGEIYSSGPCYDDQHEIEWEDLGMKPELTTVTKLPRRIFTFSKQQLGAAMYMCDPNHLFLNFANYLSEDALEEMIRMISDNYPGALKFIGMGPEHKDVHRI